jgi:hypothetical protein
MVRTMVAMPLLDLDASVPRVRADVWATDEVREA